MKSRLLHPLALLVTSHSLALFSCPNAIEYRMITASCCPISLVA